MKAIFAADMRRRWLVFGGLAVLVVIADQISKLWVDANFALASARGSGAGLTAPSPILGDFVRVAKSYNDGGLFGLFGTAAPVLAVASVVVIALLVYTQWRTGSEGTILSTIALGLLLGGALGNFFDRIRLGFVIDWVDTGIGDLRWYTFNVADAAISLSIIGLVLAAFLPARPAAHEPAEAGR
ncbi:MAG: signal peptidase II [Candidatus Limnocylindrales bacterium]